MTSDPNDNEAYSPSCPKCGYTLTFDPLSQTLTCRSCGSKFNTNEINEDKGLNYDQRKWQDGEAFPYRCPSCGAEVIYGKEDITAKCTYCGSNLVLEHNLSGTMRPNSIIPFKIDEKSASGAVMEYLRNSGMNKKSLDECRITDIYGMYVPFWTYSSELQANGRIRLYRNKNATITRYITGSARYQSVPEDASSRIPNKATESLEPFDFSESIDFNPGYLSGFAAERYDLEPDDLFHRARQRMRDDMQKFFLEVYSDHHDEEVEYIHTYSPVTIVRYVLCPIWFVRVSYKGNDCRFYVNGQTGRTSGKIPVDLEKNRKISILALIALQIIPLSLILLTTGTAAAISLIVSELIIIPITFHFLKKMRRPENLYLGDGARFYRVRDSEKVLYNSYKNPDETDL